MSRFKSWSKRAVLGTTAVAVALGGVVGWHFVEDRGEAGVHGAVVDMDEQNGMLLRDLQGRPAFVNYFDSMQDMELNISIATTHAMPHALSDPLGQLTKFRQEHVSRKVAAEDYRPIDAGSAEVIRDFFREFEALTGVRVNVRENDSNADITIGGYNSSDKYIGFASFPQEIPQFRHLRQNRGFMMLDAEYIQKKIAEGNIEAVLALVSHEFGHNLGLLHPHDGLIDTAMNDKQQDAVSRMSYNNHSFPAAATTDIDSGFGPMDIYIIREALREMGVELPRINAENDTYLLSELAEAQREQARAKGGYLASMPALSLLDNGGHNSLEGTSGDDLLVTESGYCGLLKRDEKEIRLIKDGQPYCLVEGEFSVVRSGAGDDLILTANGTEQTVYVGTGDNEVALLHPLMGDKTIVTLPVEDERGPVEKIIDTVDELNPLTEDEVEEEATKESSRLENDTVTLTLHQSLMERGSAVVHQNGEDITANFFATSGRKIGSFTLQGQAAENRGIDVFRVIDDNGDVVAEYDVRELRDAQRWQDEVLTPAQETVQEAMLENFRADYAKARQALAGRAGEWTSRGEDPAIIEEDVSESGTEQKHAGGCGCAGCMTADAPSRKPVKDIYPQTPVYPNDDHKESRHVDTIMKRRRAQESSGVAISR